MFLGLGRALGYDPRLSFSRALPTDGAWLSPALGVDAPAVPVVAIEVVVSESRKTIRGSLLTLEMVSPSLGVILVHEEELRRRHVRAGRSSDEAQRRISSLRQHAAELAAGSRQRIEVWTFAALQRRFEQATGACSPFDLSSTPALIARAA
jgi:hypothetical protein